MSVFVDTSALFGLLDLRDASHGRTVQAAEHLAGEELVTHSFVVIEAIALTKKRLGNQGAARLIDDVLPSISIVDVDTTLRIKALAAYRHSLPSKVSIVDRTSFEFMRQHGITQAWAVDADFEAEGFELV